MQLYIGKIQIKNEATLAVMTDQKYIPAREVIGVQSLDELFDLKYAEIKQRLDKIETRSMLDLPSDLVFSPFLESQIILGAGVTFKWDQEKIQSTPDEDNYKKVYFNDRPMLFMKAFPWTVRYDKQEAVLRNDSHIIIPESEAVAFFNSHGEIVGYGVGNDLTYLDFERQNPLYQMQAKLGNGSSGLLSCFMFGNKLPNSTMKCSVTRDGKLLHSNQYSTEGFYRTPDYLMNWVNKMNIAPRGGGLSLGCGVPYPAECTLIPGDQLELSTGYLPWSLHQICKADRK